MGEQAGAGSILDGLKARRDALAAEQVKELAVPGFEPAMWLRVQPLDHATIRRIFARTQKAPDGRKAEAEMDANASAVAGAVVKVVSGQGEERVEFDLADLAGPLEVPEGSPASATIRALCLKDGDVIALANAVMKHSGYAQNEADEAFAGE